MQDFRKKNILKKFHLVLLAREELYWREKAGENWFVTRDLNTKLFHASVKSRRARNRIEEILIKDRSIYREPEKIEEEAVLHFKDILASATGIHSQEVEEILKDIPACINEEDNNSLLKAFSLEEVGKATFQLHSKKTPGSDGFPTKFYQRCWNFIGQDVFKLVEDIRRKKIVKDINNTIIALIPKKKRKNFGDYRPISLCNTIYKNFTKAFANTYKEILEKIISEEQNGFVAGREIMIVS